MDLYVMYSERGTPYSDFECEQVLLDLTHSEVYGPLVIHTSTENIILASRALHHRRKLVQGLYFLFRDYVLESDQNGRIREWPNGFADHADGWLLSLLN